MRFIERLFAKTRLIRPAALALPGLLCLGETGLGASVNDEPVMFSRDIRPILSDNCFPCHGFDASKRKGDLRLDTAEGLASVRKGKAVVRPGNPEGSELWKRVSSADPSLVMPPPEGGKHLNPEQLNLIGKWIQQGGAYQKHWAFEKPVRPDPPPVGHSDWVRNDIDRFVLAGLESKKLSPTPEASRETLIRRVSLDLTGLPPTISEVDAFLADTAPGAYERVVDQLLNSLHYGEQMARYWLDIARYGDTHGLHLDNERSMWRYRDWVVEAFNTNLPFSDFTIWQLAGDLLPNPTAEQLIASGFNRCNVSTSEGGAIDEEFRVRYAVDRVETTSTAWLGLTMGCAVCHDHKLDPISQKEFYQVFSVFNNIAENAMDGNALLPPPSLPVPTVAQQKRMAELDQQVEALEKDLAGKAAGLVYVDPATLDPKPAPEVREVIWVDDEFPPEASVEVNAGNEPNQWVTEGPVLSGKRSIRRSGKGLHQVFFARCAAPLTASAGSKLFAYVYLDSANLPKAVMLQFNAQGSWNHRGVWGDPDAIEYGTRGTPGKVVVGALPAAGSWSRLEIDAAALGLPAGTSIDGMAFTQFDGTAYYDKAGILSSTDSAEDPAFSFLAWEKSARGKGEKSGAPGPIQALLQQDPTSLGEGDRATLRAHYIFHVYAGPEGGIRAQREKIQSLREERAGVEREAPSTMISRELEKPRPAWVLLRGAYDKHGEPVQPGVPSVLPPLPAGPTTNRLTFAKWLVDEAHPLTARVTVNRFWAQCFGTGIVRTAEDFGTRGDWPSNPQLLDWLATEFIRSGWDVKALLRLMVTSSTYRQSSETVGEEGRRKREADPENRLLARGPRHRLDAEAVRDCALAAGGLLNPAMGGRGARSYQPPGIWEAVGYTTSNTAQYTQDHGEALYRRSLYLFWKRTAPPATMTIFDAPSREQCRARRERTNTPLQALVTMNDPQFFEAARHLAERILREPGAVDRLRFGFRVVTSRYPTPGEEKVLAATLEKAQIHFQSNPDAAKQVIAVGESPAAGDLDAKVLASYTVLANLLLNLDEALTRN